MPMRRTRRRGRGPPCRTGRLTSPATKWWRRWTRSASTARSSSRPFRCTATTRATRSRARRPIPGAWPPPGPRPIVKPVARDDPDFADVVADWKKTPGTVGIRIMLTKENRRDPNHPGLDRIARAAVRHDFPVNLLCWDNLEAGTALIDRHPDTRFILDHLGILQPRVPPAPPEPWADLPKVLELARRENAVIKISGACTLSREPYPFPDIWDPLARIFDAWGFERCLWGTDWTRAFAVVSYEQAVRPFLETDRLTDSERAMLMGGACAKAYRWSPKKD